MIDLTKPMRFKLVSGLPVHSVDGPYYRVTMLHGGSCYYPVDDFNKNFENVPEPRKPREWQVIECTSGLFTNEAALGFPGARVIRVIEWPLGKPLPEWPSHG